MNYNELYDTIQTYTENQFPEVYLADGSTVSAQTQINTFIRQAEQRIYNSMQFPTVRKNVTGVVSPSTPYLSAPNDFLSVYSLAVIDTDGAYEYLLNKDVNYIRAAYPNPSDAGLPKYYALFGPKVISEVVSNELSFILGPKPDAVYSVELHYYYYPLSIVQGVATSITNVSVSAFAVPDGRYVVTFASAAQSGGLTISLTIESQIASNVEVVSGGSGYVVNQLVGYSSTTTPLQITAQVASVDNPEGTSWLGDNFDSVLLYGSLVEAYTFMKGETDVISMYENKYKEALGLAKRLADGLERGDAYRDGQYKQKVI
jgi:hypothetical protein